MPLTTTASSVRPLFGPHRELAHFQRLQPFVIAHLERVPDEVTNRGQHGRHEIRILRGDAGSHEVLQQQPRRPVNQEHLLDPVDQRVEQDDLCEGLAGPAGIEAPAASATTGCARASC